MTRLVLILAVMAVAVFAEPARAADCAPGYAVAGEACTLQPPANSTARSGGGWACNRGFFETDAVCQPVRIPQNAALSASGHSWTCNRGFAEIDRTCRQQSTPMAPVMGKICPDDEAPDGVCVPMEIPRHATRAAGTHIWLCNAGFQEISGQCVPTEIPRHAHVGAGGDRWLCDRGYRPLKGACAEIDIPNNASLGYFGDVWTCNRGYYEIRGVCLPDSKAHRALMAATGTMLRNETLRPTAVPERRIKQVSAEHRNIGLTIVAGFIIGGVVVFLMREPPARYAATYKMTYAPRPRGSGLTLTWRSFGNRIDALTGAPIAISANTAQCRNCRAWYHAESAVALRKENGARCVACDRIALTQSVA